MTVYLSNRDGNGKTSEEGHYKFTTNTYTGNVLNAADLAVTALGTPAMRVNVSTGQYRIPTLNGAYAYTGWNDSTAEIIMSTSSTTNPRISTIVMYVDKNASTSPTPPDNPGVTKFMSVDGTPAASPVAPTNAALQTAVGAANPYIILADVLVPTNATTVVTGNITDRRTFVKLNPSLLSKADLGDILYPVGSLYTNATNSANPATLLGFGTWVAFAEGRMPVGKATSGTFATGGGTGGAETMTLTAANLPNVQGHIGLHSGERGSQFIDISGVFNVRRDVRGSYIAPNATTGGSQSVYGALYFDLNGGTQTSTNNLPPYVVVYIWRRTA